MGKVEIHGLTASPLVRAVLITAKAIGVPYELKELNPMNKTPEFKKMNPQQQIPVMVDDDLILPESRAIMQYLANKYSKEDSLYPKDAKARAMVDSRLHFDCGTLLPKIFENVLKPVYAGGKPSEENIQEMNKTLEIVEEFLTRNKWVAGPNLTLADISFNTILYHMLAMAEDYNLSSFPKIRKWMEECKKNIPGFNINDEGIASLREIFAKFKQSENKA